MSDKKGKRQKELEENRRKVIELSKARRLILGRLISFLPNGEKADLKQFAQKKNIPIKILEKVMIGRFVFKGESFEKMLIGLEMEHMIEQIKLLCEGIPDKQVAMAAFSENIIFLVYDLHILYHEYSGIVSIQVFSEVFSPKQNCVRDILSWKQEAINTLSSNDVSGSFHQISKRMRDKELDAHIISELETLRKSLSGKADSLQVIVDELLPKFPSKISLAKELGVHKSTLRNALNAESSEKIMDELLQKAEILLKKTGKQETAGPRTLLEKHGGVRNKKGIENCLTPSGFQLIEMEITDDLIRTVLRAGKIYRGLLNLIAQNSDVADIEKAKKALSHDVEETVLTLKILSAQIPSNVLKLWHGQREVWAQLDKDSKE